MTYPPPDPVDVHISGLGDSTHYTLTNPHLLVDLAHVTQLDPAELGVLLGAHRQLRAYGGRLTLAHVSQEVTRQLADTAPGRALLSSQRAPAGMRAADRPAAGASSRSNSPGGSDAASPKLVVYAGGTSGMQRALRTERDLALAAGIIMAEQGCTQEVAFALMAGIAENTHIPLAAVAADIAARGGLDVTHDEPSSQQPPRG